MALMDELNAQMKQSMLAKDKVTLSVVRMLKTALVNEKIKLGHDLSEEEEKSVLATELKQRKESVSEFTKGRCYGRVVSCGGTCKREIR